MKKRKVFILAGLGYGDEGKGAMVDFLVRRYGASAVVKYTGGPQAAHYVTESGGRWHCFSQFGSGTLVPGVVTHISRHVLIKPQNILVEELELQAKGVTDALQRLTIDPECSLVTPYHAMIGQMLEIQRGTARHGSVGIGVGQAALDRERGNPPLVVKDTFRKEELSKKLKAHRDEKIAIGEKILGESSLPEIAALLDHFKNHRDISQLEEEYRLFAGALPAGLISDDERIAALLAGGGPIVFEGAQGALIDCEYGFWPYVTKTGTGIENARELLLPFSDSIDTTAIGILRAYSYRHGPGPLVTEDDALDEELPEVHNKETKWQGRVRRGWPDLLSIRYALAINGSIDVMAITHLDRLSLLKYVKICTSYQFRGPSEALFDLFKWHRTSEGVMVISDIFPVRQKGSDKRTLLLEQCQPLDFRHIPGEQEDISTIKKAGELPARMGRYLDFIQGQTIPVGYISVGPTAHHKIIMPCAACTE
jgi:adenylosuccinate synthase